ncbi:MAG: glycosyl transferase [Nitrospiraceae bacterium]
MRISIVIPTLNEESILLHTLTQTASLSFDELIIADGGSQDRTREIVTSFSSEIVVPGGRSRTSNLEPRTSLTLLTSSPGRARQMNAGAAASYGDVILFLHADTQLPPDARQAIEKALEDPECVGGRFDVRFAPNTGWGRLISRMMNLRSRWTGIATGDQAIFVRRSVFNQLGGFPDIPIMEDIEFSRRLRRAGRIAALHSIVTTSYRRWNTCGPIRTILLMWSLRSMYWIGINPRHLKHFYGDAR